MKTEALRRGSTDQGKEGAWALELAKEESHSDPTRELAV